MTMDTLLEGPSLLEQARDRTQRDSLVGRRVCWLSRSDLDRSGRGYYFPRYGTIAAITRFEIAIDEPMNFCVQISSLVELVERQDLPVASE
jgi:hypothetical protein